MIRRTKPSHRKRWLIVSGGVVAIAVAGAILGPPYAHSRALGLVQIAEKSSGSEAQLDYRIANLLDAHNKTAAVHTAQAELAAGRASKAVAVIKRAGESPELLTLKIEAEMELNQLTDAATNAQRLLLQRPNDSQTIICAWAYARAGEGTNIQALEARVSSPRALQSIKLAETPNVALVDQLRASGLPVSSSAMLNQLPDSPPKQLRLAELTAFGTSHAGWDGAAVHYQNYLSAMPADQGVRRAYANLLDKLGRTSDAQAQRNLASKLQAGQP